MGPYLSGRAQTKCVRACICECVCSSFSRYIYFMPLLHRKFSYSMHTIARIHAFLFFRLAVSVIALFLREFVFLPGLYWKCNYRDFRRKMGENREMKEERQEHCEQIIKNIERERERVGKK